MLFQLPISGRTVVTLPLPVDISVCCFLLKIKGYDCIILPNICNSERLAILDIDLLRFP